MVTFGGTKCVHSSSRTMSFMCPLEMCVIIHIERAMIFKNYFVTCLIALNVQRNLQPSAPSFTAVD